MDEIEGTLDIGKFSLIGFGFHFGISLRQMACNGEVIVKCSSTSFPHPVKVFGRDVLILVKDNNLLRASGWLLKCSSFEAISPDGLLTCGQIM